ncbi:MAG: hypothetical protein RLY35_2015 [Bacteroidota bacterium]|jgi:hypothetical protein
MRKLPIILALLFLSPALVHAQELNCNVTIIPPRVITTDAEIFKTMEGVIEEFMNSRKWTKDSWDSKERIDCSIQITIEQQVSSRQFLGSIQVSSSRPVFNSNYKTTMLSINDKNFGFTYQDNANLQWSQDQHRDNLTSVLAYYAYLILAMDYDSFAPEGGTDHYLLCQTIVTNAQNAPEEGWKASQKGQQNRYWIIENILSQSFKPLREALYNYHRQGLDVLYYDIEKGRNTMAAALEGLRAIHKIRPSSYNLQIFFYGKAEEIINVFKPAPAELKKSIYELCKLVDPGNIAKYERIMAP